MLARMGEKGGCNSVSCVFMLGGSALDRLGKCIVRLSVPSRIKIFFNVSELSALDHFGSEPKCVTGKQKWTTKP